MSKVESTVKIQAMEKEGKERLAVRNKRVDGNIKHMKRLFQDESGDCSFSNKSRHKHFLITILSIDPPFLNKVKNRLKGKFAHFIKKGWDKTQEVKAFKLNKYRKFGRDAVSSVLNTLITIPSLEINYIIVNKENITNQSFRNAPYGTAYNYFTGVLLSEIVFQDGFNNVYLVYDKRNKESHQNKHFQEYLKTKIFGIALENNTNVSLSIAGDDSHQQYGLLAVDYFSWAIFRKFEYQDDFFFKLFEGKLRRRREWYI